MIPKPCYITSGPHLSGFQVTLGYETLADTLSRSEAPMEAVAWQKPEIEQDDGEICVRAFTTNNDRSISFSIRTDKVIICNAAVGEAASVETVAHSQLVHPVQALAVIPTEGLGSFSQAKIPTEGQATSNSHVQTGGRNDRP